MKTSPSVLALLIVTLSVLSSLTDACGPPALWKNCPKECKCYSSWFFKGVFVDCSCQKLVNIPQNIPKDTIELDLSHNTIFTIPHINLLRMKRLDMGYNQLNSNNIDGLSERIHSEITSLKLAGNQLMKFPLGLPKTLLHLDFSDNGIAGLTCTSLSILPPLETLNLASNFLTLITKDSFCSENDQSAIATSLHRLDLSRNSIFQLDDSAFHCLQHLEYLNLSYNSFTVITSKHFQGLLSLQVLDLSSNSLLQVADGAFASLSKLEFLNLAKNQLTTAPRNLPPNLILLDLSNNAITTLKEDPSLVATQRVLLAHNPLNCNCNLRWIKAHLVESAMIPEDLNKCPPNIIDWIRFACPDAQSLMPRCANPTKLAGEPLNRISESELVCHDDKSCTSTGCPKPQTNNFPRNERRTFTRYPRTAKLVGDLFHHNCPRVELTEKRWFTGRSVNASSILIEWDTPKGMEESTFEILYYKFGYRNCTVQAAIDAREGHFLINHLHPSTNYIVCIIPRHCPLTETPILLELCLELSTRRLPLYKRFFSRLVGGCSCCSVYIGFLVLILLGAGLYLMSAHLIRIGRNAINNVC